MGEKKPPRGRLVGGLSNYACRMWSMTHIRHAVETVGGAKKLAYKIGVPVQSVYFWLSGARRIPADYCPAIERETERAVRCEQLRPDVDWSVLRGTTVNHEEGERRATDEVAQ